MKHVHLLYNDETRGYPLYVMEVLEEPREV